MSTNKIQQGVWNVWARCISVVTEILAPKNHEVSEDDFRRLCAGHLSILIEELISNDRTPENDSPEFKSKGKVISFLMPSRGRPESLCVALRNIVETCDNPELVEILIRLDDDDMATLAIQDSLKEKCAPIDLRIIVGPRGGGYKTFHLFVNELTAQARGDFLFLYNDDARIQTKGWDQLVLKERGNISILHPTTPNTSLNLFPIVHRKIVDLLGHFSLNPHCDTWVESFSRSCGLRVHLRSLVIEHVREEMKDETYTETSSAYATTSPSFFAPEATRIRRADTMRVLRYLVRCGRRLNIQE